MPIENTSSGVHPAMFMTFCNTPACLSLARLTMPIDHCVLVCQTSPFEHHRRRSAMHPQPFQQCQSVPPTVIRTGTLNIPIAPFGDGKVAQANSPAVARAGRQAGGALHGLQVLGRPGLTRRKILPASSFWRGKTINVSDQVPAKTTLLMAAGQQAGATGRNAAGAETTT